MILIVQEVIFYGGKTHNRRFRGVYRGTFLLFLLFLFFSSYSSLLVFLFFLFSFFSSHSSLPIDLFSFFSSHSSLLILLFTFFSSHSSLLIFLFSFFSTHSSLKHIIGDFEGFIEEPFYFFSSSYFSLLIFLFLFISSCILVLPLLILLFSFFSSHSSFLNLLSLFFSSHLTAFRPFFSKGQSWTPTWFWSMGGREEGGCRVQPQSHHYTASPRPLLRLWGPQRRNPDDSVTDKRKNGQINGRYSTISNNKRFSEITGPTKYCS